MTRAKQSQGIYDICESRQAGATTCDLSRTQSQKYEQHGLPAHVLLPGLGLWLVLRCWLSPVCGMLPSVLLKQSVQNAVFTNMLST